jgi:DNA topoisomerase I
MKKSLVIVESPAKAKTISKILGDNFKVASSMGHIIDLPQKKLGVDIENNFKAEYVIIPGRQKALSAIKKEAKGKEVIYIATDPDREGEAIGWQLKRTVFKKNENVLRVTFHEITPTAVKEAFKHARDFDNNMLEAQAGRRVLDRIVGYFLSPLLWKKIARGLSAGRVQSAALRIIIDREKDIQKFTAEEYWQIEAKLSKEDNAFLAKLDKIEGKKVKISTQKEAEDKCSDIKKNEFRVSEVKHTDKKRYPNPPFITSSMQQEAFNKLKFSVSKTMMVAQQLYEGIDIGEGNPIGLITYMRTDSPRVSSEAISEVREYIVRYFGKESLPEKPNYYKVKKLAQEAHEAIRPTFISRHPEGLKAFLTPEQLKLYTLIYNRFVASQMKPAVYKVVTVNIEAGKYNFTASGSSLSFLGFTAVYNDNLEGEDNSKKEEEGGKNKIPLLKKGDILKLLKLSSSQHFTKPPARYSDSSLIKALEDEGIGRPSTYAPIIYTLILRDYARRIKGYFHPTELGFKVCDLLVEYFPKIVDLKFTALMEEELDGIEEGKLERLKVLNDFYQPFKASLDFAQANVKKEVITTNEVCDKCGKPLIVKWGRRGKFLSCS